MIRRVVQIDLGDSSDASSAAGTPPKHSHLVDDLTNVQQVGLLHFADLGSRFWDFHRAWQKGKETPHVAMHVQ
jgi:hypothetical protein